MDGGTPMARVELSVSAKKLQDKDAIGKSDPVCILYMKGSGQEQFVEIGRTEMIENNHNPQWIKKFQLDYRFEEKQLLLFRIYDWDTSSDKPSKQDALGSVECSLGEIMSHTGGSYNKDLADGRGSLHIAGEEVTSDSEKITLNMVGEDLDKKDLFSNSDPFLIFYKKNPSNEYIAVHKTEVLVGTLNPVWKPIIMPTRFLDGNKKSENESNSDTENIKIECYDWDDDGGHDLIGVCFTNFARLLKGPSEENMYALINEKKKAKKKSYENSGKLILKGVSTHKEASFLEYLQRGTQIHFTVAIDFTASNSSNNNPSLHALQEGVDNQYAQCIKAVGEIIQDYDLDKMFPALGFGAKLPSGDVSDEFFLNGHPDNPYCHGVQGILSAYYNALSTVKLYGPTNFAPVINHVSGIAKSHQGTNSYFVLLIITDGEITDLQETQQALVMASCEAMSVIIVGVGDADFSSMEFLDGDEKRLASGGKIASRDIVQFVEFRKYVNSSGLVSRPSLATAVLKEIPSQFLAYMKTRE